MGLFHLGTLISGGASIPWCPPLPYLGSFWLQGWSLCRSLPSALFPAHLLHAASRLYSSVQNAVTQHFSQRCAQSYLTFVAPWTVAHEAPLPWYFPGKITGVGCHLLLQGIFPTEGSNPRLLHWQAGSLPLAPPEKPLACCRAQALGSWASVAEALRAQ